MNNIKIDKYEVLRYLGHQNQIISSELDCLIDICIDECQRISKPRFYYRIFDCKKNESYISLENSNVVLKGFDIYSHLSYSKKVAIMAATLGVSMDSHIRISQAKSITKALILDACANDYIEKICDFVQEKIRLDAKNYDCEITSRFSPGYGDFPIEIQNEITSLLDTSKQILLTCSPNHILIPKKSVTAIIGLFPTRELKSNHSNLVNACGICQFEKSCALRKKGQNCGR